MGYHYLSDSGMSAEDRRNEASRICSMLIENDVELTEKEQDFVDDISNVSRTVSTKQLFWLRDIKDKYF